MTRGKFLTITLVLGACVLVMAWSTALTLLLGRSLNSMAPWAVISFMVEYGFSGSAGSFLVRSFLLAFIATATLAGAIAALVAGHRK